MTVVSSRPFLRPASAITKSLGFIMQNIMLRSMCSFTPELLFIASKIRILDHFLNDRDLEELTLEDMAGASMLAKELAMQINKFSELFLEFTPETMESEKCRTMN